MDVLRAANCDEAQGYLIAKPLPPEAFKAWMMSRRADIPAVRSA